MSVHWPQLVVVVWCGVRIAWLFAMHDANVRVNGWLLMGELNIVMAALLWGGFFTY